LIGRILDRYVLKQLVPYFTFGLLGFVLFLMIFDAFDKIDVFVDHKTPFGLILSYYLSGMVFNAILVAPMSMLMSTFLVFGQMARFNEVTAMKTAGLSLYRIFLPVYLFAFLVSIVVFWIGEEIMPNAQKNGKRIYNEQIKGRAPRQGGIRLNLNYLGSGGRVYAVRRYDIRRKELREVVIQEFDHGALKRRVDAVTAEWRNGGWLFHKGVLRTFEGDLETAVPFESMTFPEFTETPEDLAKEEVDPNQMSYRQLSHYVDRLKESGRLTAKYATERDLKMAFPLVNLMAVLIATPLATRLRRGGVAIGFGLSVLVFFAYIALVRFGEVLGHAGQVPPWCAAWLGNIVFGLTGLTLLVKAAK
jgi:lipopolysaccharide export system permease protein